MLFKKNLPSQTRPRRTVQQAPRSTVFSYYTNRSLRIDSDSSIQRGAAEQRQGRRASWTKRVVRFLGVGLIIVLFALSLRLSNDVRVVPVGTSKGQVFLRQLSVYEAAASQAFSSLSNSNKLTVNTDAIVASLERQFPELNAVSVSLPFIGSQPVVYVQPATPRLILTTLQDGMFILDSSGRALISAQQVPDLESLQLPVVADESGIRIKTGEVALPQSTVAFIDEVVRQLAAKGVKLSSLTLPAGTNELHVRLTGESYYVKFNLYGNAREETGAFLALKAHFDREKRAPSEYIDVRVEGRAYYK